MALEIQSMINIFQKTSTCIILLMLCSLSACQTTAPIAEKKINVAILMPLTGKDETLGKRLASLIQLGMEDNLQSQINLTTYDARDEKAARMMMDKIIAKKTKIVLGPLFSPIAQAVIPQAEANNITMITLSNNPALASGNIYVFGHAPMRQTEKIINHFLHTGYRNLVLLMPNGTYSKNVVKVVEDMAFKANANPVRIEYYGTNPEDIANAVLKVSQIVDELNEMEENATKPLVYIADDQQTLPLIFSAIHKDQLDKKAVIIGDNRADILFPEGINLYFTGSLNHRTSGLAIRARELFGIEHLNFMDLMAYDLGRMVADKLGQGLTQEQFIARIMHESYIGASGTIKFEDNIAVRNYDIIKRTGNDYTTTK